MIGGGIGSFIGAIHRNAANLDNCIELVSGSFSSDFNNSLETGKNLGNIIINGKLMFIYQAFLAFSIWHNLKPNVDEEVLKILD